MDTNLWLCTLIVTCWWCLTGRPDHQNHDLISHSVTLSWQWAEQSLAYSSNAERKWHVLICTWLLWLGREPNSRSSEHESRALPIIIHSVTHNGLLNCLIVANFLKYIYLTEKTHTQQHQQKQQPTDLPPYSPAGTEGLEPFLHMLSVQTQTLHLAGWVSTLRTSYENERSLLLER